MYHFISKSKRTIIRAYHKFIGYPVASLYTNKLHILKSIESIEYIIENKCSVSRFGDGEFNIIWGRGNKFQDANGELGVRLKEVLSVEIPNLKVGIPYYLKDCSDLKDPVSFWMIFTSRHIKRLSELLEKKRLYLDAHLSRFYNDKKDKSNCASHINTLRKIWEGKDILLVEGEYTRSGVGNDLYDNAKSLSRILAPSENAFSMYEKILATVIEYAQRDQVILIALGMTATVLAYDLTKVGFWAIDIGHVDIEYEWYLSNSGNEKTVIKGKYVMETVDGDKNIDICTDKKYLSSIICSINQ